MLTAIARFDIKFRWLIVAVWVIGAIAASRFLPGLSSVTQSNNAQFLPADAPSQQAAALAAPFQTANVGATAVIVASRSDVPLTADDDAAISGVERAVALLPGVVSVVDQGTSADGEAPGLWWLPALMLEIQAIRPWSARSATHSRPRIDLG